MQPPIPPGNYSPPAYPVPATTSAWAVFSLIAAILAWLGVFGLGGIAAIISAYIAKNEIKNSGGRVSGNGMATAGLVMGWLNVVFACLMACLAILLLTALVAGPVFFIGILPSLSGQ
jgi:hypothetical protein